MGSVFGGGGGGGGGGPAPDTTTQFIREAPGIEERKLELMDHCSSNSTISNLNSRYTSTRFISIRTSCHNTSRTNWCRCGCCRTSYNWNPSSNGSS
jgi:hypothetical protein